MDRTTATNFTVLFMFLNLLFWTFVWEPVANTLHLPTLCQLALFQVILFLLPTALYLYFTKSSPKQILRLNRLSLKKHHIDYLYCHNHTTSYVIIVIIVLIFI